VCVCVCIYIYIYIYIYISTGVLKKMFNVEKWVRNLDIYIYQLEC